MCWEVTALWHLCQDTDTDSALDLYHLTTVNTQQGVWNSELVNTIQTPDPVNLLTLIIYNHIGIIYFPMNTKFQA